MKNIKEILKNKSKDIYQYYGFNIEKKGNHLCPFHNDKNPSLSIDRKTGLFNCFGCNESGDVLHFIAKKNNLLIDKDFLRIIKIGEKIIGNQDRNLIATYEYKIDDKIVNCKYKYSSDPKYLWKFTKNKNGIFPIYNFDCLKQYSEIFIAEGEKDCQRLIKEGIQNVISFPHGAENINDEFITPLLKLKNIFIVYDNDKAGQLGTKKIINSLASFNFTGDIFTIHWPSTSKEKYDVSDFFDDNGRVEDLKKLLHRAEDSSYNPDLPEVICLADVIPESQKYLVYPYFVMGAVNNLVGRMNAGKGTLIPLIGAIVSKGKSFPLLANDTPSDHTTPLGNILYIGNEDSIKRQMYKRFAAAGADMRKIFICTEEEQILLGDVNGFEIFKSLVDKVNPVLVIIDPITALLRSSNSKVDMNAANHTRPIMGRLNSFAEEKNIAIICIQHRPKSNVAHEEDAGIGSQDIGAVARSINLIAVNPDSDRENPERIWIHSKANGTKKGKTISFHIENFTFSENDYGIEIGTKVGRAVINGYSEITYSDLATQQKKYPSPLREEAETAILDALSDEPMSEIELAKYVISVEGISNATYTRAKKNLKQPKKTDGEGNPLIKSAPYRNKRGQIIRQYYSLFDYELNPEKLYKRDLARGLFKNNEHLDHQVNIENLHAQDGQEIYLSKKNKKPKKIKKR